MLKYFLEYANIFVVNRSPGKRHPGGGDRQQPQAPAGRQWCWETWSRDYTALVSNVLALSALLDPAPMRLETSVSCGGECAGYMQQPWSAGRSNFSVFLTDPRLDSLLATHAAPPASTYAMETRKVRTVDDSRHTMNNFN